MGLGWPELTVIAVILIALFGWKRMPDMARSLGRSARIFKSEVDEMKKDGQAAQSTVTGAVLDGDTTVADADRQAARTEAEQRLAEAEAKAAEARAEAERLRGDSAL